LETTAADAHGLADISAEEVRRSERDGHLHALVAGVQGAGELGEHPLADLDGLPEVTGLAVAAAQRDRGLDPEHAALAEETRGSSSRIASSMLPWPSSARAT
jgi:hypothetical protein